MTFTTNEYKALAQRYNAGEMALKQLHSDLSNKRMTLRQAKFQVTMLVNNGEIAKGVAVSWAFDANKCRTIKDFLDSIKKCEAANLTAANGVWRLIRNFD